MPHAVIEVPADVLKDPRAIMCRLQEILFGSSLAFLHEPHEIGQTGQTFWDLDPRGRWAGVIKDGKLLIQYNGPLDHWTEQDMVALALVLPKFIVAPGSVRFDGK